MWKFFNLPSGERLMSFGKHAQLVLMPFVKYLVPRSWKDNFFRNTGIKTFDTYYYAFMVSMADVEETSSRPKVILVQEKDFKRMAKRKPPTFGTMEYFEEIQNAAIDFKTNPKEYPKMRVTLEDKRPK